MNNLFGIMQGRLLPKFKGNFQAHPLGYWEDEFEIAARIGFDSIEFILDFYKFEENPLMNDIGIDAILFHSDLHNIKVRSICADYFMSSPVFTKKEIIKKKNKEVLKKLIETSKRLGVTDIVIPLVDNSSVLNSKIKQEEVSSFLREVIKESKNTSVNLCLETDLPPRQFLNFIESINESQIKINYDTGNSASLGYNFREELDLYGHLVSNIHIKDRKLNSGSVPLGLGDCNFKEFFQYLTFSKYQGIFILQAFREDNALLSLNPQYEYIKLLMNKYFCIK